jgi:hypothetical protein
MRNALLLLWLLTCGAAGTAASQSRPLTPVAQLGFMGAFEPAVTGGARWSYTPTPQPRRNPRTGMSDPVSASWSFEALATAGVSFAEGDPVGFTAIGSAGVLRPIGTGTLSGVGLMALGSLSPNGIGPAVRVETSFRALGAQAGLLWLEHRSGPRAAVTIDVEVAFVCDLIGC